jgi:hypothetical protein
MDTPQKRQPRDKGLYVRMREDELEYWRAAARKRGMMLSEFVRACLESVVSDVGEEGRRKCPLL